MQNSRFIICEKRGKWATALRKQVNGNGNHGASLRVFETRSHQQCLAELSEDPNSFVGLELKDRNAPDVFDVINVIRSRFPGARVVVFGDAEMASVEPEIREAGAIHVAYSPRQLSTVAKLAERHAAQASPPEMNLRQSVMARLPWGK